MNYESSPKTDRQERAADIFKSDLSALQKRIDALVLQAQARLGPYYLAEPKTEKEGPSNGRLTASWPPYFHDCREIMWEIEASIHALEILLTQLEL